MNAKPRFSLKEAASDHIATGRPAALPVLQEAISAPAPVAETAPVPAPAPARAKSSTKRVAKTERASTRQGARGITVWVEPEMYRMMKLVGVNHDRTMQDLMIEAIDDLLAKNGKGRLAKQS